MASIALILLILLLLFLGGVAIGCTGIASVLFLVRETAKSIQKRKSFLAAKTANIPASESLVRASSEPMQAQQAILLRAASETTETHEEQLLRASVEGQE